MSACVLFNISMFLLNSFFLSLIFSIVSFSNLCFLELDQFMSVLLRFIQVFVSSLNSLNFLNMFIAVLLDCLGSHLGDYYWRTLLQGGRCLWGEILSYFHIACAFPPRAWYLEVGCLLFACLLWDSGAPACGEFGFSFHCCVVLAGF